MSTGTYAQLGQKKLLEVAEQQLRREGRNPYVIPVGGSNALGAWGYIEAVRELQDQMRAMSLPVDHLVFACGSGGTATGLALACRLSGLSGPGGFRVHAVGVCDSADYFYAHMRDTCLALGVDLQALGSPRDWCAVYEGQGNGYARSTPEELEFIVGVGRKSKPQVHLRSRRLTLSCA